MADFYEASIRVWCSVTKHEETVWFRVLETEDGVVPFFNGCDNLGGCDVAACREKTTAAFIASRKPPAPQ